MLKLFVYVVLLWSVADLFGSPTGPPKGQGRALYQFAIITYWITDRNPLHYNDYGCHCGRGSKGLKVVDAIDQCCVSHDSCYKNIRYDYDPVTNDIQCTDPQGTAEYASCECDRQAALCFRRSPYNAAYKDYPASKC